VDESSRVVDVVCKLRYYDSCEYYARICHFRCVIMSHTEVKTFRWRDFYEILEK